MKRFIAMGIVLFITSMAYYGCRTHTAEEREKHMEKRADWVVEKISDELDLTKEQQATLQSIKSEVISKQQEVKLLREGVVHDLFSVLEKETVNENELNTMFSVREAKLTELRQFAVAKYAQFHNSLTKEQRVMLRTKLERYKKYHD